MLLFKTEPKQTFVKRSFVYYWDLTNQYYMSVLAVCQSISVSIHKLINEKLKKRNHVMNIYLVCHS